MASANAALADDVCVRRTPDLQGTPAVVFNRARADFDAQRLAEAAAAALWVAEHGTGADDDIAADAAMVYLESANKVAVSTGNASCWDAISRNASNFREQYCASSGDAREKHVGVCHRLDGSGFYGWDCESAVWFFWAFTEVTPLEEA